jgi:hypothetical protein
VSAGGHDILKVAGLMGVGSGTIKRAKRKMTSGSRQDGLSSAARGKKANFRAFCGQKILLVDFKQQHAF